MSQENRERPRTKLKTLDELFLLDKEYEEQDALARKPVTPNTVPINELIPFSNHPFRLYDGERLDDMVESIKKNDILVPIIVRTTENGRFEILSGHNRANALRALLTLFGLRPRFFGRVSNGLWMVLPVLQK